MNKKVFLTAVLSLLTVPVLSFAQPGVFSGNIYDVVNLIISIFLNVLWTVAVAFVIVMFVIAGFRFFQAHGEPTKVAEARQFVVWGLAGTAVIVLAWSVLAVVRNQFGV